MPVLNLSHKGYSLQLVFPTNSYYVRTQFEPGKTLYQILVEHLIDGRVVSPAELAKRYKKVNFLITEQVVALLMRRIEAALKTAKDKRLREMHFLKKKRGVYVSNPEIMKIINDTILKLYGKGGIPKDTVIREACLQALHRAGLAKNVILDKWTIRKFKRGLELPARPQPPWLKCKRRMR